MGVNVDAGAVDKQGEHRMLKSFLKATVTAKPGKKKQQKEG